MPSDNLISPSAPEPAHGWLERLGILPAAALFVAAVITTLSLWRYTNDLVKRNREQEFRNSTSVLVEDIDDQISQYRGTIRATQGLFVASEEVTRGEWRRYVETLNLSRTGPRLTSLAYVAVVSHGELPEFISRVQTDASDPMAPEETLANFQVDPPGEREEYYLPTYIEPFLANIRAFGFDLRSDPARREALELARDTGEVTATGKQNTISTGRPSFAINAPVYEPGLPLDSLEDRRRALRGFIIKTFETENFFRPVADRGISLERPIDFLVFDISEPEKLATLLFSSDQEINSLNQIPDNYLISETWEPLFQRQWRIIFFRPPSAGPQSLADYVPQIILAAGLTLSFLLFLSVASLTSSFLSGAQLAKQMTQRLRLSEEQYRNIFASLRDLLFHTDLSGKILLINPSAEVYLHRPPADFIGVQAELLFTDPAFFRGLLERIKKGEQIANITTKLNQNGQTLTVSLNAYVLHTGSGAPQEIEWVLRDISGTSSASPSVP